MLRWNFDIVFDEFAADAPTKLPFPRFRLSFTSDVSFKFMSDVFFAKPIRPIVDESRTHGAPKESTHRKKSGTCQISSDDSTSDRRRFRAMIRLNMCDSDDWGRSLKPDTCGGNFRRFPKIAVGAIENIVTNY